MTTAVFSGKLTAKSVIAAVSKAVLPRPLATLKVNAMVIHSMSGLSNVPLTGRYSRTPSNTVVPPAKNKPKTAVVCIPT